MPLNVGPHFDGGNEKVPNVPSFDSGKACVDLMDMLDEREYKLGTAELKDEDLREAVAKLDKQFRVEGEVNEAWHVVTKFRPKAWYQGKAEAAKAFFENKEKIVTNIPSLCDPVKAKKMAPLIKMMSEMGSAENGFDHGKWERMVKAAGYDVNSRDFRGPDGLYNILLGVERAAEHVGGVSNLAKAKVIQIELGDSTTSSLRMLGSGEKGPLIPGGAEALDNQSIVTRKPKKDVAAPKAPDVRADDGDLTSNVKIDVEDRLTPAEEEKLRDIEKEPWHMLLVEMEQELLPLKTKYPVIASGIEAMHKSEYGNTVGYLDSDAIDRETGKPLTWVSVWVTSEGYKVGKDDVFKFEEGGKNKTEVAKDAAKKAAEILDSRLKEVSELKKQSEALEETGFGLKVRKVLTGTGSTMQTLFRIYWQPEGSHVGGLKTEGTYRFEMPSGKIIHGRLEGHEMQLKEINVEPNKNSWKVLGRVDLGRTEESIERALIDALHPMIDHKAVEAKRKEAERMRAAREQRELEAQVEKVLVSDESDLRRLFKIKKMGVEAHKGRLSTAGMYRFKIPVAAKIRDKVVFGNMVGKKMEFMEVHKSESGLIWKKMGSTEVGGTDKEIEIQVMKVLRKQYALDRGSE